MKIKFVLLLTIFCIQQTKATKEEDLDDAFIVKVMSGGYNLF